MNKLSYSAARKFQECAKSYEYHYINKYRSKYQSSALVFGTAIDVAFGSMLKKESDWLQKYEKIWKFQKINDKYQYLPKCVDIVYSDSEMDFDLLLPQDHDKIKAELKIDDVKSFYEDLKEAKQTYSWDILPYEKKLAFNFINWFSLFRKGIVMLNSLEKNIVPNIIEVLDTQTYVKLVNADGDVITGFADMVVRYKGYDKPMVLDLKTSSKEYSKDSVITSPQLSLYIHSLSEQFENTRLAGFLVVHKQIRKNKKKTCSVCKHDGTGTKFKTCPNIMKGDRCDGEWVVEIDPEAFIQVIIDEIPEQTETIVMENLDQINRAIKSGEFVRSFTSCVKGWGKCEFYNLCYFGNDRDLVKK